MKVVGTALMVAVAAIMTGCEQSKPSTAAAAPPPSAAQGQPAAAQDGAYIASGPLVVENQLDVVAEREGIVAQFLAEPGTEVKRGQVLALLDDRQIAADRDAAAAKTRSIQFNLKNWEAELQALRSDFDRTQKMWEAQLTTKEQLDHDRYKVVADEYQVEREKEAQRNAEATQRSLELEFEKTRIRAPFNGVVARRYVRIGQKVAVGDRIYWVTATGPLQVRFTLPERYVGRLKKGLEVGVSSVDIPELKQTAKIIQVSPVVDPSSGTIEVLAEVVAPSSRLRPGMTANIRIDEAR